MYVAWEFGIGSKICRHLDEYSTVYACLLRVGKHYIYDFNYQTTLSGDGNFSYNRNNSSGPGSFTCNYAVYRLQLTANS